mmetsp:Transcript_9449/g.25731  ORF Transcript_9449/g.25731 Transcript_9449/m.25731 type:complete len:218 (+) Transcript_9449:1185-1838(+)
MPVPRRPTNSLCRRLMPVSITKMCVPAPKKDVAKRPSRGRDSWSMRSSPQLAAEPLDVAVTVSADTPSPASSAEEALTEAAETEPPVAGVTALRGAAGGRPRALRFMFSASILRSNSEELPAEAARVPPEAAASAAKLAEAVVCGGLTGTDLRTLPSAVTRAPCASRCFTASGLRLATKPCSTRSSVWCTCVLALGARRSALARTPVCARCRGKSTT